MLSQNEFDPNRVTQKHNSHFYVPLFIDLYHNATQIGTLQVFLASRTKEVLLPSNVSTFLLRASKNIPAILKQNPPELLLSIPFETLSIDTLVRELRSRFYLLRNGEESVSTFLQFLKRLMEYFDASRNYSVLITTQLISILKELRLTLREDLALLPRFDEWIRRLLSPYRDFLLEADWEAMDSLQRSAGKDTLFFILWIHDSSVEAFIDRQFGEKSIEILEFGWVFGLRSSEIPGDFQEMAALRYCQKRITQENYMSEIDRIVSKVYANRNANVVTPLSLLEADSMIAYLFKYILWEKSSLYTQNILYLIAHLNQNISFNKFGVYDLTTAICRKADSRSGQSERSAARGGVRKRVHSEEERGAVGSGRSGGGVDSRAGGAAKICAAAIRSDLCRIRVEGEGEAFFPNICERRIEKAVRGVVCLFESLSESRFL